MNPHFFTGIIELKRKISVTLLRCIMTIVQIGFGASQRNLERTYHTNDRKLFKFDKVMYMDNDIIAENENYKHLSRCEH